MQNILSKEAMELWIPLCDKDYAINSEPLKKTPRQDPTQIHDRRNARYFGIPIFRMV